MLTSIRGHRLFVPVVIVGCCVWLQFALSPTVAYAQIFGANYNERPRDVNAAQLDASQTTWTRGFLDIFQLENVSNLESNVNIAGLRRAADSGQELLVSLKWHFSRVGESVPVPGSTRETELFDRAVDTLEAIGRPLNSLILGNEPMFETLAADKQFNNGTVPYVEFTERLLNHVQTEFGSQFATEPRYFLGALNRLELGSNQNSDMVQEFIRVTRDNPDIAGMDIHVHFDTLNQAEGMIEFARDKIGSNKDLLVTEFSPVWRYQDALDTSIGASSSGAQFASQYGYSPTMQVDDYLTAAYDDQVSRQEWADFTTSQPWYNTNHLTDMNDLFRDYDVSIATLGFSQPLSFRGTNASSGNHLPFQINWLYAIGLIEGFDFLEAYNEPYMEDWLALQHGRSDVNRDGVIDASDYRQIKEHFSIDLENVLFSDALQLGDTNLDQAIDMEDLAYFFDSFEATHGFRLGDLNGDGLVDTSDWPILLSNLDVDLAELGHDPALWISMGDFDESGFIDRFDFRLFKDAVAAAAGVEAASIFLVPEPASVGLLLGGCIGLHMPRRRRSLFPRRHHQRHGSLKAIQQHRIPTCE